MAYLRPDRSPDATLRDLQRGNPRHLRVIGVLTDLGTNAFDLVKDAFEASHIYAGWYEKTDALDGLLAWVPGHPSAGVREFRNKMLALAKLHKLFPDGKRAKAFDEIREGAVGQKMVCSSPAKKDGLVCPGCQATIEKDEFVNEARDEIWHSMCAPKDDIVVGELLNKDDGELIRLLTLKDVPGCTEYTVQYA